MRLIALSLLIFLASCNPQGNQQHVVTEVQASDSNPGMRKVEAAKPILSEDTNITRHLVSGEYNVSVSLEGSDHSRLKIHVQKGDTILPAYERDASGQILTSLFSHDLNTNGFPEFYISTRKGSQGWQNEGFLYSYEIKNGSIHETIIPELNEAQKKGYRGGDRWVLDSVQHLMIRKFKLFLFTDADCCPTGGERFCNYSMDSNGNFVFKNVQSMERIVQPLH